MNRVLEHKTPSDSLRLLTNKLVVNCWSDSVFIWWLSFKDTEQILGSCGVRWDVMGWHGMGWDGMWWGGMGWDVMGCLLGVVAGTECDLGQIISIARLPFPYICSPVPPEHRYLCLWKPCCWLWSPTRVCPGGDFSPEWGRTVCGGCWGSHAGSSLQAQVWLSWSGWRKVCAFQKCILAFCTLTSSNTALEQQKGWHQIKIPKQDEKRELISGFAPKLIQQWVQSVYKSNSQLFKGFSGSVVRFLCILHFGFACQMPFYTWRKGSPFI